MRSLSAGSSSPARMSMRSRSKATDVRLLALVALLVGTTESMPGDSDRSMGDVRDSARAPPLAHRSFGPIDSTLVYRCIDSYDAPAWFIDVRLVCREPTQYPTAQGQAEETHR